MSRKSETGDELVKSITTEERRVANATDLEMDASKLTFYPLAKAPFLQDRGDVRTVESPFMPPSLRKADVAIWLCGYVAMWLCGPFLFLLKFRVSHLYHILFVKMRIGK